MPEQRDGAGQTHAGPRRAKPEMLPARVDRPLQPGRHLALPAPFLPFGVAVGAHRLGCRRRWRHEGKAAGCLQVGQGQAVPGTLRIHTMAAARSISRDIGIRFWEPERWTIWGRTVIHSCRPPTPPASPPCAAPPRWSRSAWWCPVTRGRHSAARPPAAPRPPARG